MKLSLTSILLFISLVSFGQHDIDIDSLFANDPCYSRPPATDLMENSYWGNYLTIFRKGSIYQDTSFSEAYRLLYWGTYFAIVDISVRDSIFFIVSDSMNWTNDDAIHRRLDTITINQTIVNIRNNCELMWEYEQENNYTEMVEDDRDNWAFEFKIDDCYMSLQRYDMEEPLKDIIVDVMRIGKLSGYNIH